LKEYARRLKPQSFSLSRLLIVWLSLLILSSSSAGTVRPQVAVSGPEDVVYKTVAGTKLIAHVFRPSGTGRNQARPAIVLFHGGGWAIGSPDWVYDAAKRYASCGAVTVAAQYRLSDKNTLITPIEALEDARDVVRWMRRNASELGIDTNHIAAYGVSAGGHLAASLAFFDSGDKNQISAVPNATLLISPAVSLGHDQFFQGLLGKRALAKDFSPDEQMAKVPPPTIIFNGSLDDLTPLEGAKHYCDRMISLGGECELHAYDGTGHLFTRKQPFSMSTFDPDPKAWADATANGDDFLARKGFLPEWQGPASQPSK
jgi:acetyl esterase/lipase